MALASYVELAGFPYHALDTYLPKLVRSGAAVRYLRAARRSKMTKTYCKT
ncbi:MAG: hypothetical protein IPF54_13165 [Draconibacterium sp.]|nr:hypothetical protein [Draconibacterium sp.]